MDDLVEFLSELQDCGMTISYNNIVNSLEKIKSTLTSIDNEVNDMLVDYASKGDYTTAGRVCKIPEMSKPIVTKLDLFLQSVKINISSQNIEGVFSDSTSNVNSVHSSLSNEANDSSVVIECGNNEISDDESTERVFISDISKLKLNLKEGSRITHVNFGSGSVLSRHDENSRINLIVKFDSGMEKSFSCTDDILLANFELTNLVENSNDLGAIFENSFVPVSDLVSFTGRSITHLKIGDSVYSVNSWKAALHETILCIQDVLSNAEIVSISNKYLNNDKQHFYLNKDDVPGVDANKSECNGLFYYDVLNSSKIVRILINLQKVIGSTIYVKLS